MGQTKIVMKRALRGLYGGRHIQFGNQVSEDGGNKTRRSWKPNRQRKRLFSVGLDRYVRLDVTTHALRCMDRVGGLDEYMLKMRKKDLDGHALKLQRLKKWIGESYKKRDDAMVPPNLEEKVKKMITWSLVGKKKEEVEEETKKAESEAKSSEPVQEWGGPPPEGDYIDEMFAKFSIDKEDGPGGWGRRGGRQTQVEGPRTPSPPAKPEEFPETLFSDVV